MFKPQFTFENPDGSYSGAQLIKFVFVFANLFFLYLYFKPQFTFKNPDGSYSGAQLCFSGKTRRALRWLSTTAMIKLKTLFGIFICNLVFLFFSKRLRPDWIKLLLLCQLCSANLQSINDRKEKVGWRTSLFLFHGKDCSPNQINIYCVVITKCQSGCRLTEAPCLENYVTRV